MANPYLVSFMDPFDPTVSQPKIHDGSVDRSSGVRLKATGTFQLDNAGAPIYAVLYPAYSYTFEWKTASTHIGHNTIFPAHLDSVANRANIKQLRLVSAALKLSLENSADENEGFWEAVRIPLDYTDFQLTDTSAPVGENFGVDPKSSFAFSDMSNFSTYQTGRLKDLERFLFKLNSVAPDHPFKRPTPAEPAMTDVMDEFFDVVVIKLTGRVDATTPSTVRYQVISNQEVVYKENTQLSRLMIGSTMLPNMGEILSKTKYVLPAIQVA